MDPNEIYYRRTDTFVEAYITDASGKVYPVGNQTLIGQLVNEAINNMDTLTEQDVITIATTTPGPVAQGEHIDGGTFN